MLLNNATYKYENPYNDPFVITQFCTNGTVTLQRGAIKIRHNKRRIKLYISDASIENIKIEKYL